MSDPAMVRKAFAPLSSLVLQIQNPGRALNQTQLSMETLISYLVDGKWITIDSVGGLGSNSRQVDIRVDNVLILHMTGNKTRCIGVHTKVRKNSYAIVNLV